MASEYQNAGNFIDIPSVNGSVEIKMFDLAFNNVKPLSLIKYILALASGENSIVLDFCRKWIHCTSGYRVEYRK